ncbi:MAG: hypothetical protein WAU91_16650 [Desulfatitalea sp.]
MRVCIVIPLIIAFGSSPAWPHGVEGSIAAAEGYLVTARYDDGEPLNYAAVEVLAPDSDLAFQTGRADRNGRLMFLPDRPGRWQVAVTDGMGHRTALVLEVNKNAGFQSANPTRTEPVSAASRALKMVTGLALIFGLFGLFYAWKARRAAI